jgi:thiol:disulfide interchange protein DsbD
MIKVLAFLISFFSFFQQSEEPVKWQYELDKIENNKFKLTFNAEIIDGWKLYSQYSPIEGNATEFKFFNSELISNEEEKFYETEPIIGYDNVFKLDLPYFVNEASFYNIIDLKNINSESFKVEIFYSSCDDELCVFRNETFNIPTDPSKELIIDDNVTLDDMNKYNELKFDFKKTELVSNNFTESINFIEIFIFGLIAGFLALLTPCIFPMIPLTVSYFLDETKLKF